MAGKIIYKGNSLLDNEPIVVISIESSRNRKTGNMLQTYILCDNGKSPLENNKTGSDYSICGNCVHRGKPTADVKRKTATERSCYVNLAQGVLIVWKNYMAGKYANAAGHASIANLGADKMVRIGTYGDPSAVPSYVWESLISKAKGHTAYSHQANVPTADFRPDLYMASADSVAEAQQYWQKNQRTFRVVSDYSEMVAGKEIACPADTRDVQCVTCGLCKGSAISAKSIAIVAHGAGKSHFGN